MPKFIGQTISLVQVTHNQYHCWRLLILLLLLSSGSIPQRAQEFTKKSNTTTMNKHLKCNLRYSFIIMTQWSSLILYLTVSCCAWYITGIYKYTCSEIGLKYPRHLKSTIIRKYAYKLKSKTFIFCVLGYSILRRRCITSNRAYYPHRNWYQEVFNTILILLQKGKFRPLNI